MDKTLKKLSATPNVNVYQPNFEQPCGYLEFYESDEGQIWYFVDITAPGILRLPFFVSPTGMEELQEIKNEEDLKKYCNLEYCGKKLVVVSYNNKSYSFQKIANDHFTLLLTDKNYISTNGRLRIFITKDEELIFRVEDSSGTCWADYNSVWGL